MQLTLKQNWSSMMSDESTRLIVNIDSSILEKIGAYATIKNMSKTDFINQIFANYIYLLEEKNKGKVVAIIDGDSVFKLKGL